MQKKLPPNLLRGFLLAVYCLVSTLTVYAQQPGTLDTSFNPADSGYGNGDAADNTVYTTALQSNGKIMIGGRFINYNGTAINRIARLNADGSLDATFVSGTGLNNDVQVIAVQPDGKILVGGNFTTYNGTSRTRLARLNSNGTLDASFDPGTGANSLVASMAVQPDGKIIIGGSFTSYNGTTRYGMARLNSNGSLDTGFDPVSAFFGSTTVFSISLQSNGKVVAGGNFTKRIARLNADGSQDATFNPGTGPDNTVYTTAVQSDGKIFIGGAFAKCNGTDRYRAARLNADGSLDATFLSNATVISSDIRTSALQSDGKILVGGSFYASSLSIYKIGRFNTNGSLDTGYNPVSAVGMSGATPTVFSIALQPDGKLVYGGDFNQHQGARNRVARLNANATIDAAFNQGTGSVGNYGSFNSVEALAQQADGKIIVGGGFATYNGTFQRFLVRTNSDGSIDNTFNGGSTGPNNSVTKVVIQPDGKILISGWFTQYNGVARNGIARLNANGTLDTGFNPGTGLDGSPLNAIALQPDGKIIIGGDFSSYNGVSLNKIARLNADGSIDTGFNIGTGADLQVYAIAVQPDGKIFVGGYFTQFNGTTRDRMVRLNSNGSVDLTFFNKSFCCYVYAAVVQPDGKILIGGDFTGTNRTRVARMNADGSWDTGFNTGSGANASVRSLLLQADGKVIITGDFTSYTGIARGRLARLNADGSLETGFDPGSGAGSNISAASLQADGKILIGGVFTNFNGVGRNRVARVTGGVVPSVGPTDISLSATAVDENVADNSTVATITSAGAYAGEGHVYALVTGAGSTDNAFFNIYGDALEILNSPDFEIKSSYNIRIQAMGKGGLFFEKAFTITVTNENETPISLTLSADVVNENVAANTTVGTFATTDPDAGNTFTYSLVYGAGDADNAAFNILGNALRVNASPDFETQSSYNVRIRTTDQGGLFNEQDFIISVMDVNDSPVSLVFPDSLVYENAGANMGIGNFITTDQDPWDTHTYSLVAGPGDADNTAFTLDAYGGLYINADPDFEAQSVYSIRVRTTDPSGLFFEKAVTITVLDVNETPVNLTLSATALDENVAANTLIGSFTTTDPDSGDAHFYSLEAGAGDADNAAFTLTAAGDLSINHVPDFEDQASYSILVRSTDLNGLSFDQAFTITVNDIAESTPVQVSDFVWAKQAHGFSSGHSIATDAAANNYVTGSFSGNTTFGNTTLTGYGIFVAKFDALGNALWAKSIGGASNSASRIAIDGQGNSYVTGTFWDSAAFGNTTFATRGINDVFVAKYDASGNVIWAKQAGGTGSDVVTGIAVDGNGSTYVSGSFAGSAAFGSTTLTSTGGQDAFIAKYDALGNVVWTKQAGGTGYDQGNEVAVDGNGNSYMTGYFQGSATFGSTTLTASIYSYDVFVAKYDASGNVLWAKQAGGGVGVGFGSSIAADSSGNAIVTGYFSSNATFGSTTLTSSGGYDIFVAKYDASGNVLWAKQAGGRNDEYGISIALDGSGNSFVTGGFNRKVTFGSITLYNPEGRDVFIVKYDAAGNEAWAKQAGGAGDAEGSGIAVDGYGNCVVTGAFSIDATFGSTMLTESGGAGMFIAKVSEGNATPTGLALSVNSVNENVVANTAIGMLSTTDPDTANTFTYSLVSGAGDADNAAFNISGGSLRITASPDFETKSSYSIRLRTMDQGGLFFEQDFVIMVNDLNEAPVNVALSAASVNENVAANTLIGTFGTTDLDAGNTHTYSLVAGTGSADNAAFTISGNALSINNSPDFETQNSYSIRVRTTDQDSLYFEKSFTVTINDVNEAAVMLSASAINENVAANTTIGTLSAIGTSGSFTYSLVAGTGSADNATFSISGNTLRIRISPNFEVKNSYSVRVRATSGGAFLEQPFTVSVNDVNELPTALTLSATALNEHVAANTAIGALTTTDPDAGNAFTYTLVSGTGSTDNAAFSISGDSLRITASPDFEAKSSYSVRLRTTDQGGLFFDKALVITIKNVNETPFNLALSATAVNENVAASTVVGTFLTSDPDAANTFTYALVAGGTDNAAFNIYGSALRISATPNYEVKKSYSIRIRTTDQGGLFFEKDFTITINDVNDAPSDLALSATSVYENKAALSAIGALSSVDQDSGSTFTYTLVTGTGSTDNAAFSITDDSLRINASPNYEVKKIYSIRLRTTDQGGRFFEKVFTIAVLNENETPLNLALSATALNENVAANTTVGTFTTTDPDAANTFTYSLASGGADNAAFNILGNALRISASPNFEAKDSYSVLIRTTDQGGLVFEKSFTVTVNDLNDTPTDLALSATSVNENVAAYTLIGKLSTTDQDAGSTFTYSLVSGTGSTDNASFSIAADSVKIKNAPNYEAKKIYSIRLRTTDQGGRFFDKFFAITVNDLNETPTNLELSASSILENVAANTTVGTFTTTDQDAGNTFTYTFVSGGTDNAAFSIVGNALRIKNAPDFEAKNSYAIRIRTTDQGGLFFEKNLTIAVTNVNEAPVSLALSADSVYENVAANTMVGTFTTTDPDAGNTFTYSLVTGTGSTDNAAFNILGNALRISASPNFEVKDSYSIRIRTRDQGGLYLEQPFVILVNDVNDAPNNLILSIASVKENVAANTAIGAFSSVDQDAGNSFTYSLVSGTGSTDNAAFTLSGDSLAMLNSPDFEAKNSYSIRLRTTDQGGLFFEKAFTIAVTNVNETPLNLALSATAVNENVVANTTVGIFTTTDPDAANTFTYALVAGGTDNAAFNIYGSALRISASPNFEAKNSYSVRVRATDQGGLFFEKDFTITINNVNDAPSGLALSATALFENVAANTLVGKLTSLDQDSGTTFTYSLVSGTGSADNAAFSLAGDSLRIVASPNFEAKSSYSIRLRTMDQGGAFFEKIFVIAIKNVNETPVNLALSVTAVNENVAGNTTVGTLTTTDPDAANSFTYAFVSGGADNAAFSIVSGSLRIKSSPNFEAKNSYSIRIRTTDQGGLFLEKTLTIAVANVNEAPTGLALSADSVNEHVAANATIATLRSTDPDAGNTFTYSLVTGIGSADNAAFSILGDSLKITASPVFAIKSSYSIRLRTTDQGGLFFEKPFTIVVNELSGLSVTSASLTGTKEDILTPVQLLVYPNPSNGTFNLELGNAGHAELTVTDLSGKTILQATLKGVDGKVKESLELHAATGIYLLRINADGRLLTRKLIVE